jgi:integrase
MAILAECPICHRKQSTRNKHCAECGDNLDKQKRNGKVRFYVIYRLAGKQHKEFAGYSIEEARDAEGKRRAQKREGRILEMLPQSRITFNKLSEWFLSEMESELELTEMAQARGKSRKGPSRGYFNRVKTALNAFNATLGDTLASDITQEDLKRYRAQRERTISPYTQDVEFVIIRSMINAAFDADKVDGRVLKAFRKISAIASTEDKTRKRVVSIDEYKKMLAVAPDHLRAMLVIAMNTGMRHGEIRLLQWPFIDRKAGLIRLPATITKNKQPRVIPLSQQVREVIDSLPRHLHGYVITYKGKPLTGLPGVKGAMKTACREANLPYGKKTAGGIIFHDFRRSAKTNMVKAGVNKIYRDLILGHSLQGMDKNYIVEEGLEDELKQAMNLYSIWMVEQFPASVTQNAAHEKINVLNSKAKP